MSELEYEITDRFRVELESIQCRIPVELSVTSEGDGDKIVQRLEYRMRLACYEAAEEFDGELQEEL